MKQVMLVSSEIVEISWITLLLFLATLTSISIAISLDSSVEYRAVFTNGTVYSIVVDPSRESEVEVSGLRIPLYYNIALETFSRNIVKKTVATIALEQVVCNNNVVLSRYSTDYLLVVFNNTYYELFFDKNTGLLVYGFIKENELEIEITLRTKISCENNQTYQSRAQDTSFGYEAKTVSTDSSSESFNTVIYIVVFITLSVLFLIAIKLLIGRKQ